MNFHMWQLMDAMAIIGPWIFMAGNFEANFYPELSQEAIIGLSEFLAIIELWIITDGNSWNTLLLMIIDLWIFSGRKYQIPLK